MSALEIMKRFQQGLASGTSDWEALVSDEIVFQGPVDTVRGKSAFIELNQRFSQVVRGYRMHRAIEQDGTLATEVQFQVATPSGKTISLDMAEFYVVQNEQITSIKVFYDAEEFRREMGG